MIAEGKYTKPTISAVAFGETSNGNDVITISFTLDDGQTVDYQGYLTDKAADYAIEALRNCGFTGDDILRAAKPVAEGGLVGAKPYQIVVRHEDYDGKTYARVRFINTEGGFKPLADDRKKSLRERMKAKLAATAGGNKGGSDDVPFTV